jgi:hypothetical protein
MSIRSKLPFLPLILVCASCVFAQGSAPKLPFDGNPSFLIFPGNIYLGEAAGVAHNSKGHLFVFSRDGSVNLSTGTSRTFVRGGARLFEFDENGKFVREIGQDLYGFVFAENVRVDAQDNIWAVDSGSNMVIKFDPQARILMTFGRKPEAVTPESAPAPGGPVPFGGRGVGAGVLGDNFYHPADVAFDAAGNIFVADGHGNSRIAKFDNRGRFIKTWGAKGSGAGQFNSPHSVVVDAKGNVYVADRGNNRIQVFDNDGNFKTEYHNLGSPLALCITPGPHQYIFSSDSIESSGDTGDGEIDKGEIYKMELDGTIVGKFGSAGKGPKEFGTVHALDCQNENQIYAGDLLNWRVNKITLHASGK